MRAPTVIIRLQLGDNWGDPEQLSPLSDGELRELIEEDPFQFMDEATWSIER